MAEVFPILHESRDRGVVQSEAPKLILWLQVITLAWMAIEAGISLYAAVAAHSIALLAFGSDSLVELLSAGVVLLSVGRTVSISRDRAARWAGSLLFLLAALVINAAFHIGWIDSVAALAVLPILVIEGKRALRSDPCSCC